MDEKWFWNKPDKFVRSFGSVLLQALANHVVLNVDDKLVRESREEQMQRIRHSGLGN
jgi:hypothetical protein